MLARHHELGYMVFHNNSYYDSIQRASEMARSKGIPLVYLSANSGARIGVAEEVRHNFKVAWMDPNQPEKVNCIVS